MSLGLVGRKTGMTRIFDADGGSTPVTVIEIFPNRVSQVKTIETDGYQSIQVAFGDVKASKVNKPMAGHFSRAGLSGAKVLKEFTPDNEAEAPALGSEVPLSIFAEGQFIDVRGVTKGKGFAGAVKRHHFRTQDATHGNSLSHRAAGSIGQNQSPGRVFKGKKMAGHLGSANRCQQNLRIVKVDNERSLIMVRGSVPGAPGGTLLITPTVKKN